MVQPAKHWRGKHLSCCLDSSGDGRVALERVVRAALVVVDLIRAQRAQPVPSPIGMMWSVHSRRMLPITRSTYAFCQGDCGAEIRGSMFITLSLRRNAQARAAFGP